MNPKPIQKLSLEAEFYEQLLRRVFPLCPKFFSPPLKVELIDCFLCVGMQP